MSQDAPTLLCTVSFPANTGYAWEHIERIYARLADHFATSGIQTLVAYPALPSSPRALAGSAACPLELDASLATAKSLQATVGLISRENIRVIYFSDHPLISAAHLRLRWAGVRRIIVHDHTSGERSHPCGVKRLAKWALARTPGLAADVVIAVSEYVAKRQTEVAMIPASRVETVHWGIPVAESCEGASERLRKIFGIPLGRPVVACVARATPEKGLEHLLRAFNLLVLEFGQQVSRPVLLYMGDGPQLANLEVMRQKLAAKEDIILAGYRLDAAAMMAGADLCVVPSVWQEAFCLAALEGMANGKAVIASSVGAIPEIIQSGVNGILVPPGDEDSLAQAMRALLLDPAHASRLGRAARKRVAEKFDPEKQIARLIEIVGKALEGDGRLART